MEMADNLIPLEVKYESQNITFKDIQGLIYFCLQRKSIQYGYVLTKAPYDIGLLDTKDKLNSAQIMRIPASIFCYWLGESEIEGKSIFVEYEK
jgi:hypothetical protein